MGQELTEKLYKAPVLLSVLTQESTTLNLDCKKKILFSTLQRYLKGPRTDALCTLYTVSQSNKTTTGSCSYNIQGFILPISTVLRFPDSILAYYNETKENIIWKQ
jgi:hypothetical protein